MSEYRAVATYRGVVQVGPDEFKVVSNAIVLRGETTIGEVREWMRSLLPQQTRDPCVSDLMFSSLDAKETRDE